MENKVAIIVDSGMDLPKEYHRDQVFILPLQVIKDGETLRDGVDIKASEVASTLDEYDYKTSLPSLGQIENLFEEVKAKGYTQALIISISSGLSGTGQAIRLVANEVEGLEVAFVDTLSIGIGAGLHAVHAIDLFDQGKSFEEVVAQCNQKITTSKIYYCVGTLKYLAKGGRIGKVASVLGHALNLKPIIMCNEEGIYDTVAKVRGRKQSINQAIKIIVEQAKQHKAVDLAIANCLAEEEMEYVKEQLTSKLDNIQRVFTGEISPALTIHTGPGLLGITFYEK